MDISGAVLHIWAYLLEVTHFTVNHDLNAKQELQIDYRQTSNVSDTWVGYKIVDHSDVVVASPVGAAPTTSSLSK